jgi:hypothetical protein
MLKAWNRRNNDSCQHGPKRRVHSLPD